MLSLLSGSTAISQTTEQINLNNLAIVRGDLQKKDSLLKIAEKRFTIFENQLNLYENRFKVQDEQIRIKEENEKALIARFSTLDSRNVQLTKQVKKLELRVATWKGIAIVVPPIVVVGGIIAYNKFIK